MPVAFPTIAASVAFTTNPTAIPSWTDISPYLRSFSTQRGRQFELDRMQAGTAQLRIKNQDRRFDPNYAAGPYYPNVVPKRRVRLQATWAGVTYSVITGYAERWPQTWIANGTVAEVTLTVIDALALFGQAALNVTYSPELSSVRVNNVLDTLNWGYGQAGVIGDPVYGLVGSALVGPLGDRDVQIGTQRLQGSVLANTTALEHLLSVAASEDGLLFISRSGDVTFRGRNYAGGAPIFGTFGDAAGEMPYVDLVLGETPIWNDVRLTAIGGVEQSAADMTSQQKYFLSSKAESGYLQEIAGDLQGLAGWWVYKYSGLPVPRQRIASLVVMPSRDPTNLWPQVLGREIGDHIIVNRRPPGGGPLISIECVIEAIAHTATPYVWTTQFSLSPADPILAWAFVGTAVVGTNLVAY